MHPTNLPVKQYLQHTNELLNRGINEILAFFGVKKTDWKILHSVYEKAGICKAELAMVMQPFADVATVNNTLIKFKIMHVIFDAEEKITLTSNGINLYKNCLQQQHDLMQSITTGSTTEKDFISVGS